MSVDGWVQDAVERLGKNTKGVSLRDIQKYIDDHYYEELAVETLRQSLKGFEKKGRMEEVAGNWRMTASVSKTDAMKKLFGDNQ